MPNIREYRNTDDKLQPSDLGYTAWETAGRRIGPLYGQMAAEVKEGGRINADTLRLQGKGQEEIGKQLEGITDQEAKWYQPSGGRGYGGLRAPREYFGENYNPRNTAALMSSLSDLAGGVVGDGLASARPLVTENKGGELVNPGDDTSYDSGSKGYGISTTSGVNGEDTDFSGGVGTAPAALLSPPVYTGRSPSEVAASTPSLGLGTGDTRSTPPGFFADIGNVISQAANAVTSFIGGQATQAQVTYDPAADAAYQAQVRAEFSGTP